MEAENGKSDVLQGMAIRPDFEIIKQVQDDGTAIYYHPINDGDPEPVKGENLYDVVMRPIYRLKALTDLLNDNDYSRFGYLAESITNEAERLYEELFHFLDRAIGEIEIDVMDRGSVVYRPGRVLSAKITAKS